MYTGFQLPMFYGFIALNVESEKNGLLDRLHNTCSYVMLIIFLLLLKNREYCHQTPLGYNLIYKR